MAIRKYTVPVLTASGTATAYSPYLSGFIRSIQYVKTDFADHLAVARGALSRLAAHLEIARSEQDRLTDLQQRQLKYSDYAWSPPAQGGTRRADDEDAPKEGDA